MCVVKLALPPSGGRRDDVESLVSDERSALRPTFSHFFVVFSILVYSIFPFQRCFFFIKRDFFISSFFSFHFFSHFVCEKRWKDGGEKTTILAFLSITVLFLNNM